MPAGVLLIGLRGAGKSVVGAALAQRLGLPFVDTDRLVEAESGRSVEELLEDGSFRAIEQETLARVLAGEAAVIAAGGGAVLWEGLRRAARRWRVVWLDADTGVLARRIRADARSRPSLTGRPADEEVAEIARERAPLYAAVAWRRIDTGRLDPDTLAEQIAELLRNRPAAQG